MRVLIAPDSFKECLSADQVACAIVEGWRRGAPHDELLAVPLADGGEGTTRVLINARGGSLHACEVTDPLGRKVVAHFGLIHEGLLIDDGRTAIVEVAEASGLHLVAPAHRNALTAGSAGTGELIRAALQCSPTHLIIGLGGSATTDAGVGMLQALGGRFTDSRGRDLPPGGGSLGQLAHIDIDEVRILLEGVRITVATDVANPLLGAQGTAAVFSPQKGASPEDMVLLEEGMGHFARCASAHGFTVDGFAGSGAAGGIGGTLAGMLGATLVSGVDTVMQAVGLERLLPTVDVVITGEGSLDGQSAAGKVPAGVCRLARMNGVPVIALAGVVGGSLELLHQQGLTAAFSVAPGPVSRQEALTEASTNIACTAEQVARLVRGILGSR